jgi:hypothetical protein
MYRLLRCVWLPSILDLVCHKPYPSLLTVSDRVDQPEPFVLRRYPSPILHSTNRLLLDAHIVIHCPLTHSIRASLFLLLYNQPFYPSASFRSRLVTFSFLGRIIHQGSRQKLLQLHRLFRNTRHPSAFHLTQSSKAHVGPYARIAQEAKKRLLDLSTIPHINNTSNQQYLKSTIPQLNRA